MPSSLGDLQMLLRSSGAAVSFPLLVAGAGLMLFGWRMWRVCVVLTYALVGAVLVVALTPDNDDQWFYALIAAAVLGAASYWPGRYAVALLGGLLGGGSTTAYLHDCGVSGSTLWFVGAAAGFAALGYAFINRQHVIVLITAFLGAALLVSGLAGLVMLSPALFGTFRSMAAYSAIVLPFLLLVPTVMSSFYQISEMRRLHVEF